MEGNFSFTTSLFYLNTLNYNDFLAWTFLPGMGFADQQKWWEKGKRDRPHEGIDICQYEDKTGAFHVLGEKTKVPFFLSGRVVAICDDFIGKTLFVHGICREYGEVVAAHSHIIPAVSLGKYISAGDLVGHFAPPNSKVPSHLHLSLIRFPHGCFPEDLDWKFLNTCDQKIFIKPILL